MKFINITLALALVTLIGTSCVEKSAKYLTLVAQRDSLLVIDSNYHQTLEMLNEVEAGFQSIRETESAIAVQMQGVEGQTLSKKQQLAGEVYQIKTILAQNKEKIAELQKRLNASGNKNAALAKAIDRLNSEVAEKTTMVKTLQAELAQKNIKIEELSGTITNLNTDVKNLNEVSAEQQTTIAVQDKDLNNVWYVIGTDKELKAYNILSGNGLFRAKTVMDKEFDKSAFTQIDLRTLSKIATESKKPKVLSSHPQESYKLVVGEDKMVTIEILDPAKFWSISKYLVIKK